jgi:hypothetical protein
LESNKLSRDDDFNAVVDAVAGHRRPPVAKVGVVGVDGVTNANAGAASTDGPKLFWRRRRRRRRENNARYIMIYLLGVGHGDARRHGCGLMFDAAK